MIFLIGAVYAKNENFAIFLRFSCLLHMTHTVCMNVNQVNLSQFLFCRDTSRRTAGGAILEGQYLAPCFFLSELLNNRLVAVSRGYDTCFRKRLVMGYADY